MNGVGIVVVENEDVFISFSACTDKFSGLISEDTARGFLNVDKYLVGASSRFGKW